MNNKITELVFILDESGSMYNLKRDTIGGFNSMIKKQKEIAGECYVTTILFNHNYRCVHDRVNLNEIKLMTEKDYEPNGTTALLDTVGYAIKHISNIHKYIRKEDIPSKTMFVIMTDGEENSSQKYDHFLIKKMITAQKEKSWEFLFIGANIEAEEVAKEYGIDQDMAVNYHADSPGSAVVYESLNEVVGNIRVNQKVNKKWKDKINKDYRSRK